MLLLKIFNCAFLLSALDLQISFIMAKAWFGWEWCPFCLEGDSSSSHFIFGPFLCVWFSVYWWYANLWHYYLCFWTGLCVFATSFIFLEHFISPITSVPYIRSVHHLDHLCWLDWNFLGTWTMQFSIFWSVGLCFMAAISAV